MKPPSSKNKNDFYKLFKTQLTPKKMFELGVFGGAYFGLNVKEYPKSWFNNAKISKNFDVSQIDLKLNQVYQEKNGRKKVGFLNKILWDGFNGTADFQMGDAFLI